LITFTDGESSRGDLQKNRNEKLEYVSEILGIDSFSYGNFPDNAMDSVPLLDICKFLDSQIEVEPDIIFTHFYGDLNIDHQLVARATFTVFRPQSGKKQKIYSYYVPSSTDYNPIDNFDGNCYFQVSGENINRKFKALQVYQNEMREYPHSRSHDNVLNLMKVWGSEVGLHAAEKFKLIRNVK
jgi:LmbE family N-acetylglucosaminyl deacetylase